MNRRPWLLIFWGVLLGGFAGLAKADQVSFFQEVAPIFRKHCNGCHHPGKKKGGVDLTSVDAILKGGRDGDIVLKGNPAESLLWDVIAGDEPSMPEDGEPLSDADLAIIAAWIDQGVIDDSPASTQVAFSDENPPVYANAPVLSSVAISLDGETVAVSGYHEILVYDLEKWTLVDRLIGSSPRITSMVFSQDGETLVAAGGSPAFFGDVQVWDLKESRMKHVHRLSTDSLFGISVSPDHSRLAVGGADKKTRIVDLVSGDVEVEFENHSDWVLHTCFSGDGTKLVSGSRDKAMKLIDASNGQFIDDINQLFEEVLSLAKHPNDDIVAYGGDLGGVRTYRISDNQLRGGGNTKRDANILRSYERMEGAVFAVAFNHDGSLLAAGGVGSSVAVFKVDDGKRIADLTGHDGAVFTLGFVGDSNRILVGGYDGLLREYRADDGSLLRSLEVIPNAAATSTAGL